MLSPSTRPRSRLAVRPESGDPTPPLGLDPDPASNAGNVRTESADELAPKGSRWTHDVAAWFNSIGWATARRAIYETGDDIAAHRDGLTISAECKNRRAFDPAAWVDQAVRQARAPGSIPVVIAHRRGKASVDDAYVILRGADFAALVARLSPTGPAL